MQITKHLFSAFLLMLASLSDSYCLLPPEYTSPMMSVHGKVEKMIIKTYKAVDQYNKINLGERIGNIYVIDYNENYDPYSFLKLDKDGNLIESFLLEYNDNGQIVTEKKYSSTDFIEKYSQLTYNKDLLTEETIFSDDGTLLFTKTFSYDNNGLLTSVFTTNHSQGNVSSVTYKYDKNALLTKETYFKDNKESYSIVYTYNSARMIESKTTLDKNEKMISKIFYTYDMSGNTTSIKKISNDKPTEYHKLGLKYDLHGNWFAQTSYFNEVVPQNIITRLLTYTQESDD